MNNNSKQILLSVIGVAVLVVAVVGVSFAMFNYSQTSSGVNKLVTGTLTFEFSGATDGGGGVTSYINLTNALPMADSAGKVLTAAESGVCNFKVTGNAPIGTSIAYKVSLVDVDNLTDAEITGGEQTVAGKFPKSAIKYYLEAPTTANSTVTNNIATPKLASAVTDNVIATATVTGTGNNVQQDFTFRMWIADSVIVGSDDYPQETWGTHWYAVKVNIATTN